MCAIFGVLGEYNSNTAKNALAKLSHRGPDYCGLVERENLFFAHQRLTIVDEDSNAHQPFYHTRKGHRGDGILLSFNGEIYNYKELKKELCAFSFKTQSDTEVLMAAYLKWGESFVEHLTGMFAIAVLDNNKLLLFRDRFGKKPLFFYHDKYKFVFASELKGITPFLKSIKMDKDALQSYLSFLAPTSPFTFFKGVKKLGAGEFLKYENSEITVKSYYNILEVRANSINSYDDALIQVEEKLEMAIHSRSESDVPMATLLSGGVDSALINAYNKDKNLMSYTLGYENFSKYDERDNAKKSAELLGIKNTSIEINQSSFINSCDEVFESLDEPLNDPAAIPLNFLFKQIKADGYKVVLSGEGSDEIFLGYRQYFEYLDIEKAAALMHKNWLKKYFRSNFSMNREWEWYKRIFDEKLLFRTSGEKFTDLQKNSLLRQNIKDNESLKYLQSYHDNFVKSGFSEHSFWYSYVDLMQFQAEHFLAKLDRVSMAHSIESRTPFLDHNLVEILFSLQPNLRYDNDKSHKFKTKALLKTIAQKRLPQEIINRKKKGFANPYMEWLVASGEIEIIVEVNEQTGLFNRDVLDEYLEFAKRGRFKQHVWGLFVLSKWIKKWLL
jgi:asparagine synthase (glutamine-hydrolysing)